MNLFVRTFSVSFIATSLALAAPVSAQQSSAAVGTVVVAKASSNAIVVWDATPFVAATVSQKKGNAESLNALKAQAIRILYEKARVLKRARTITINATYTKSGAVSPVYGSATFAGVERVFALAAPRALLLQKQRTLRRNGAVPSGFTLTISGKLPPSN